MLKAFENRIARLKCERGNMGLPMMAVVIDGMSYVGNKPTTEAGYLEYCRSFGVQGMVVNCPHGHKYTGRECTT